MRKSSILSRTGLVAGAALAASAALTVSPASAAGTWTVTGGGQFTGRMTNLTLSDNTTGTTVTCTSSSATGVAANGSGLSGVGVAAITGKTWSGCSGALGLTFTLTAQNLPWTINAVSYSAGVTTGTLTGVKAHMSGVGCAADFAGTTVASPATLNIRYVNATHVLTLLGTGNSHAFNVVGCFGLINNNDPTGHHGDLVLSPSTLQITSL